MEIFFKILHCLTLGVSWLIKWLINVGANQRTLQIIKRNQVVNFEHYRDAYMRSSDQTTKSLLRDAMYKCASIVSQINGDGGACYKKMLSNIKNLDIITGERGSNNVRETIKN